uniref:GIY-YIG endonuclease n=1 Tax=Cryphonectria parasitica TaxID=5116 RepID=A0A191MXH4_CRYPA|nr:GIY-YIG endonuclease [Cryphonectria parasitica]
MNLNIIKNISPIKKYDNAEVLKMTILAENRNKSGIYRWINNLNKNTYVGSGANLAKRIGDYYNQSELVRNPRPIHLALLKYKHSNFTLEILEYCSKDMLIEREQYYLDLVNPEYNILKHAYSLLGYKHSEENIAKFKLKKISEEHKELLSSIHTGKNVSEETRDKLSLATANYKKNNPLTVEALANIRAKTLEREGVPVTVLNNETKEVKVFTNQTEAGVFLGVSRQAVYNAIKRGKPIKGIYLISK